MNAQTRTRLMMVICMVLAIVCMMWAMGDIGATKNGVTAAARRNSGIADSQAVVESRSGKFDAMIFYDPADPQSGDSRAIVYQDRTGLYGSGINYKFAFGWHYCTSMDVPETGVDFYTAEKTGTVIYLSKNTEGIVSAAAPDGTAYAFTADRPVVLAGPAGVEFYDESGRAVPCTEAGSF